MIKAISNTAVRIASNAAVEIASKINKAAGGGVKAVGITYWGIDIIGS